jgi:hypothetical protein
MKTIHHMIQTQNEKKPIRPGEFLILENPTHKLQVQYILIVCLLVWKSATANKFIT